MCMYSIWVLWCISAIKKLSIPTSFQVKYLTFVLQWVKKLLYSIVKAKASIDRSFCSLRYAWWNKKCQQNKTSDQRGVIRLTFSNQYIKRHISITSQSLWYLFYTVLKSHCSLLFCSGLPCKSPWLRKYIQSRWKQCIPWAAAQLHLDSSLSLKARRVPLTVPILISVIAFQSGRRIAELATALPATHSKTGDMLQ